MREIDEPIPPEEQLFRWIALDDVEGDAVLPSSVDLQGTSVERGKYFKAPLEAPPFSARLNGLAVVTGAVLPARLELNGVPYEFFAVDDPIQENEAHAEIRPGRVATDTQTADRPLARAPKSPVAKADMRLALAAVMRVYRRPEAAA